MTISHQPLTIHHAHPGYRLSTEAGWNQTLADWRLLLRVGKGYGLFDGDALIATALYLPYPPLAWVSMVLVHERYRRRGLATRLMERCLEDIDNAGLTAMLDATEAGAAVYRRLGFCETFGITRFRGDPPWRTTKGEMVVPDEYREPIAALDTQAFGGNRSRVLDGWLRAHPAYCVRDEKNCLTGFGMSRPGRLARHVGPVIASSPDSAIHLVDALLASRATPVILDVPDASTDFQSYFEVLGFSPQRRFLRMATNPQSHVPTDYYAIAGPEWG